MQESLIGTHLQVQVLLNIFMISYTFYTKFEDTGKEGRREGGREGGREERGWDTGRGEREMGEIHVQSQSSHCMEV